MKKEKKIILIASVLAVVLMTVAVACLKSLYKFTSESKDKNVFYRVAGAVVPVVHNFTINTAEVARDGKLYYDINVEPAEGSEVSYIAIWAKGQNTGETLYASSDGMENNYFDLSNIMSYLPLDTYEVTGLTIMSEPYDCYYIDAEKCKDEGGCAEFDLSSNTFDLIESTEPEEETPGVQDYVFNILTEKAAVGEKIKIGLAKTEISDDGSYSDTKQPLGLSSAMLSFSNNVGANVLNVYVKDLDKDEQYFIVPSTVVPGEYTLEYAYLTDLDGNSRRYPDGSTDVFAYVSKFTVVEKEVDTSKYIFNNENYTQNVKDDLDKLDNDAIITINANANSLIDEAVFESIKGTKRTLFIEYASSTWVFSGVDIKTPKSIDVSTVIEKLSTSNYYDKFLKKNVEEASAMLRFNDNGDLPGKALIKLGSDVVESVLKLNKLYVYYYKEDADSLYKVALEVQKNNGFYEFYINHNSKYILSSKEIKTNAVSDSSEYLALNDTNVAQIQVTNMNMYVIYGICAGLLIILGGIIGANVKQQQQQQAKK